MKMKTVVLVGLILLIFCIPLAAKGTIEPQATTDIMPADFEFRTEDYVYFSPAVYQEVTGKKIRSYKEAPALKELADAGKLPPVKEILPDEPVVIRPVEKIGTYGGILTTHNIDEWYMRMASILRNTNRISEALPWFADYMVSDDAKTTTLYIKKGLKWSDGEAFTADDIKFWWEDIMNNKELSPSISGDWKRGGEPAQFKFIDEHTVEISFSVPHPFVPILLGGPWTNQGRFYAPKHYLQKWHIKYNTDATKLAKEEGYENWWEAFSAHNYGASYSSSEKGIGLPVIAPWRLTEVTPTHTVAERNPYYFAVDTEGNQLPYIDKVVALLLDDHEALMLKAYAGELDHLYIYLRTQDYPVLKENEERGNYRVMVAAQQPYGSESWWTINQNIKNPDKRKIFQDVRFRRALSVAIDREAINKTLFYGKGVPWQITVDPNWSFFKEEWTQAFPQYDPDMADRLLDEMGMTKRDEQGYRMTPAGKKFTLLIQFRLDERHTVTAEPVAKYWRAVGINAQIRPHEASYMGELIDSGEYEVRGWGTTLPEAVGYLSNLIHFPNAGIEQWRKWWTSDGEEGEEPPQEYKDWYGKIDKWTMSVKGTAEYERLGQEIMDFFHDQVLEIGTVGNAPSPAINKNYLRNIQMNGIMCNWFSEFQANLLCEQWFFEK